MNCIKRFYWTLLALLLSNLLMSCSHSNKDRIPNAIIESQIDTLKKNFKEDFTLPDDEAKVYFNEEINDYISKFKRNGSWRDLNYRLDDNKFTPGLHVVRLERLAKAYSSPGHEHYKNSRVLSIIKKAYDYWIKLDKQSYNWWHNTIGIPRKFSTVIVLLEEELGSSRIDKALRILNRATISRTGQNRLWYSEIVFIRSLFDGKSYMLQAAAKEFYGLIKIASSFQEEGMQSDLSFHQHGPLIYNGGYGSKFSLIIARLVKVLSNTSYQFPIDKLKLYSRYILDAQIWMTRSNKWDYSVTGRELTRKGKKATKLLKVCSILKNLNIPRKGEFNNCYESLKNNKNYLRGNKAFWRSDYMTHHRDHSFISLRMYSNRLLNNDAPSNSEGLMSHYLADGATYIMNTGKEYEDIFPVWDWNLIPGTTTEVKKLVPAFYEPGNWDAFAHIRYLGKSSFVGLVSDGNVGFGAMDFKSNKRYESVDIRKSYFFTDKGLSVQGDNLSCQGCNQVVTTVDQKLLKGDVYILDIDGRIFKHQGVQRYYNIKAVFHDQTIYNFSKNQSVIISASPQLGSWSRINGQYSNEIIKKNVFKLYIDIVDQFQYEIVPGSKREDLKNAEISSIVRDKSYHKYDDDRYQMVSFFKSDSLKLSSDLKLSVDKPCLVLIDKLKRKVHISDPTQNLRKLNININRKKIKVPLPQNRESGKTVTVDF